MMRHVLVAVLAALVVVVADASERLDMDSAAMSFFATTRSIDAEITTLGTVDVSTSDGIVRGKKLLGGIHRFRGIPYAAPPVGDMRFQPPAPPVPWSEPLKAYGYQKNCIQSNNFLLSLSESEDCLYLNVWTPRDAKAGKTAYPVMLWIHGGGYHNGGASLYWPERMLKNNEENVIFVSINYRLGALGFLSLHNTTDAASDRLLNLGLQDQQAALRWTQRNIAAFGGDPAKVMVFGESAGGSSVMFHMCMKSSWGLYRTALMESPGPAQYLDTFQGTDASLKFAKKAGCTGSTYNEVIDCLRNVSASDLQATSGFDLDPVVGYAEMPDQPVRMMARGDINDIPFVLGVNAAEGDVFVQTTAGGPPMNDVAFEFWLDVLFIGQPQVRRFARALYATERERYGNWRAISSIAGDYFLTCGAQLALNASMHISSNAYSYVFTQASPYAWFNVTHASEIPYVFGRYQKFTATDDEAVARIQKWWINIATSMSPNSPSSTAAHWPAYDPTTTTPTVMNLRGEWHDSSSGAFNTLLAPFERRYCAAWAQEYFPQLPPHM